MAKKVLHVHFVLDETGSMSAVYDATISGFNEYVDELRRGKEPIKFSLTQFNSGRTITPYVGAKLADVPALTKETYRPANNTPLYDAVARAIHETEKSANGKALIIIQTDGQENSSREYSAQQVRELIEKKQKEGWEFAFLGADQDAWITGQMMGVAAGSTVSYDNTSDSTKAVFAMAAVSTNAYAGDKLSRGAFNAGNADIRTKKKRSHTR